MTVGDILSEPYIIHRMASGAERAERVATLLERVGLSPDHVGRFPHEFSGGQRQRIAIARALTVQPSFLVADEPVSALDVSIQVQILNLLGDLKTDLALTVLFIAHDLGVVAYLADRVAVMYLGRIVELGPTRSIFEDPIHPYTEALLSAIPVPNPNLRRQRIILEGEVPNPANPPSGCAFRTRCPIAVSECAEIDPPLEEVSPGHFKACIRRPTVATL
jgi:oligopeptide/dipeptide ABC transporter ATP-binding protein